jgi:hypothetical protein
MALIVPGGGVAGAPSGKVGGVVFSHNRFGYYLRGLVIPTNPSSPLQQLRRNTVSSLANHWYNTLTAAQRDAWSTYAANVPVLNRVGQTIYLTGMNWFTGNNALRALDAINLPRVDDAPVVFNLSAFTVNAYSISEATQQISVDYGIGDNWEDDEGAMLVFATRPQNGSVNFNGQPFRYAGDIPGAAVPPVPPQTVPVPFAVTQGQRVWLRINVTEADGRIGPSTQYAVDVGA